ncbi:MAG: Ig-like domain-containing protein, partial [Planctomycetota bacterium]
MIESLWSRRRPQTRRCNNPTRTEKRRRIRNRLQTQTLEDRRLLAVTAIDDVFTIERDSAPVAIDVLANDFESNLGDLEIAAVSTPANGFVSIVSNQILYTPSAGFAGTDVFQYTARSLVDGSTGIGSVTANVTQTLLWQGDIDANLSTPGNWVDASGSDTFDVPQSGNTLVFNTSTVGFTRTFINNDLLGVSNLDLRVIDNQTNFPSIDFQFSGNPFLVSSISIDGSDPFGFVEFETDIDSPGLLNISTTLPTEFEGDLVGGTILLEGDGGYRLSRDGRLLTDGSIEVNSTLILGNDTALTSSTSRINVGFGGRLEGAGQQIGPITVFQGGTLAPGFSPAIMPSGDLTLGDGSTLEVEIDSAIGPGLGGYDQVDVTGLVTIGDASIILSGAHTPAFGDQYIIINNDGSDLVVREDDAPLQNAIVGTLNGVPLRIRYDGGDGNDVILTATGMADLSLDAVVDNPTPTVGEDVTYTVTLTNEGPDDATNVVVSIPLPAGLSASVISTSTGSFSLGTGQWTVPSIATGGVATLSIRGSVDEIGLATTDAEIVAADQFDPDSVPGNAAVGEDDIRSVQIDVLPIAEGAIRGYKFEDLNGNGVDDSEPRLSDVTMQLTRVVGDEDSELLDEIDPVVPGFGTTFNVALGPSDPLTFTVDVTVPPDAGPTTLSLMPESDEFGYVTLIGPLEFADVPAGETRTFLVTLESPTRPDFDTLFLRETSGLGQATINVEPSLNLEFAGLAITGDDGEYDFEGLTPGTYGVSEFVPEGFALTTQETFLVTVGANEEVVARPGPSTPVFGLAAADVQQPVFTGEVRSEAEPLLGQTFEPQTSGLLDSITLSGRLIAPFAEGSVDLRVHALNLDGSPILTPLAVASLPTDQISQLTGDI